MRPRLHLTPDRGWLNDPHGITARDGGYHLFHQAVPDSLTHRTTCSWGHATSPDLVHWEHRPTALAPDADEDGVWTGSLVTQGDDATIFYTAVDLPDPGVGRVRVARPVDPAWDTWEKGEVVVHAPEQLDLVEFRDPFVIREGSGWRMFVAGAERGGRAVVPTWVSDDLRSWGYDGVALARSGAEQDPWTGEMWECPQFFQVGDAWAMIGSVWSAPGNLHHAAYALGTLEQGRFSVERWGQLSSGTYYAPSYFTDLAGRPSLMFWIRDVGDHDEGWQSCLSVPHLVELREDRLWLSPHPHLLDALAPSTNRWSRGPTGSRWRTARWSSGGRTGGSPAAP